MERIRVDASCSYDVIIGAGELEKLGRYLEPLVCGRKCAIIADDITNNLFGEKVRENLRSSGFSTVDFVIPNGEQSKSAENYIEILEFMADAGLTRADCVVALGGGVVGDLTGFAASSFLRGIKFVQVPTTLLSAVDSSVGGKTAINLRAGKNLAGAFHQPCLVVCDTDILRKLPEEIFSEGMAEVIKYGLLGSEHVLELCRLGAHEHLDELVSECVKIKRDIVFQDEFDTGLRQLLNLGHTPAHAIELLSGFEVSHGSAVAMGMCLMARASEKMGLCEHGVADEAEKLCEKYSLPVKCGYDAKDLVRIAMLDKKRSSGEITLVLPCKRGESVLKKIPVKELEAYFSNGLGEEK